MKLKHLYILWVPVLILILFSCKKKDEEQKLPENTATLNAAATGSTIISGQMQSVMTRTISVAADSGYNFSFPSNDSLGLKSLHAPADYCWTGPDAEGWYTRSISGSYNYYERLHLGDTIQYSLLISYSGADGSFENKTTTKYIKKIKNGITLYDGYNIWEMHTSGYNDISRWEWRINFSDWNPATSAGTYDWFWGLSENSGGSTVPYHRFEHLEATETQPDGWLHCFVIFYDDGGVEVWRFNYDTPWIPVEMPIIPGWS